MKENHKLTEDMNLVRSANSNTAANVKRVVLHLRVSIKGHYVIKMYKCKHHGKYVKRGRKPDDWTRVNPT